MTSAVGSILRASTRGLNDPLQILTFSVHERTQANFSSMNAHFWLIEGVGMKCWNHTFAPLPQNHTLLRVDNGQIHLPLDVELDLVWSQNKLAHYDTALDLSRHFHLPLVSLEHCLPPPHWGPNELASLKAKKGHVNVFITDMSRKAWGWGENESNVMEHGTDTDLFRPRDGERKAHCLSVANSYVERDWCLGYSLWRQLKDWGLPLRVVGDTPGLSAPAKSVGDLAREYAQARIFLNTSLISPIPTSLLEAAACGCAIASTATCAIPQIFTHGENALLGNTADELRQHILLLLRDDQLAKRLGENARKLMVERYNLGDFVKRWDKLFRQAADIPYLG